MGINSVVLTDLLTALGVYEAWAMRGDPSHPQVTGWISTVIEGTWWACRQDTQRRRIQLLLTTTGIAAP
jgi:hypothetical protein